jgi:hypothetical protein
VEAKDVLTLVVAIAGFTVGLCQYRSTSRAEFLKPIRQAQLDLYQQASSAAARLATLPSADPEWKVAKNDFLRLYYGPLAIVEDYRRGEPSDDKTVTVEQAMIAFNMCLDDTKCVGSGELMDLSLGLAHTCRISLGKSWGFKADQLSGDYQKRVEEYLDRMKH